MKKTPILLLSVLLTAVILTSTASMDDMDADTGYEERTLMLYWMTLDDPKGIQCRFYEDMPNIPFVNFTYLFEINSDARCTTDSLITRHSTTSPC